MTEISRDSQSIPQDTESGVARPTRLRASRLVQRVQKLGGDMLATSGLTEVEGGVFSTCSEPIEKFHERVLRARDTRVPLVEISVLPDEMVQDELREVFQIDRRTPVVGSILRTNGVQRYSSFWGNEISFEDVGISIPGLHSISLTGDYGPEITAVWMSGTLSGYDNSREGRRQPEHPSTGGSYQYEHDYFYPGASMDDVLDRAAEEFKIATARDGVIDATAQEATGKISLDQGGVGELPA